MLRPITMFMGVLALVGLMAHDATAAIFNVRADYGAAGDGDTDDTQAIQNAINLAVLHGGEVYFPAGKYALSATLTISSRVTLRGEGQRTSILIWKNLPYENSGIMFTSSSTSTRDTFTVRGLSLLRNDGIGGIAIGASWAHPGSPVTFASGGGGGAVIEDVHIGTAGPPNGSVFWYYGIVVWNATAAKIATFNIQAANGLLDGAGGFGVYAGGIGHANGTPGRSVGVTIHDGTITGFTHGVYVDSSSTIVNARQLVIKDATIGIKMNGAGRGTSIDNNQIWARVYGVQIYNSLGDVAITNNRIYRETDTHFHGIEVNNDIGASARNRVIGNHVSSFSGTSSTRFGIFVGSNVADTLISGNTTIGMTTGIVLANSTVTGTLVQGNRNQGTGANLSNFAMNTYAANNW
jgi:hypothetical protein